MNKLRVLAIGIAAVVALSFGAGVSAQDEPDYTEQCDSLAQSQVILDGQVAQFQASVAEMRATIAAYDAVLGPEYDPLLNSYRAQINAGEASFNAQVAMAQANLDAANALFGC